MNFEIKLPGANLFDLEALNTLCLNFSIGKVGLLLPISHWLFKVKEKSQYNKNAF